MNLIRLVLDNIERPKNYSIKAADSGGDTADIYVYDIIGGMFWGIDALQFAKDLAAIDAPNINLHINSPGGDVFDARAIATSVKQHPANVTAIIEGLAASAATTIAMAADTRIMAPGSFFMVHNAWSGVLGNKYDMQAAADVLAQIDVEIGADYAKATGKTAQDVAALMDAETWFNAQATVDEGFADSILGADAEQATTNKWNLSVYDRVPEELLKEPEPIDDSLWEHMNRRLSLIEKVSA